MELHEFSEKSVSKSVGFLLANYPFAKTYTFISKDNYILERSINLEKDVFMSANEKVPLNSRKIAAMKPGLNDRN